MSKPLLIDFHSHILPGVDHGCKDDQEAILQRKLASQAKIDVTVATPHFYPHKESFTDFNIRRQASWKRTQNIPGPRICLGAEVFICRGMERMPELEQLCIEGTKTLLLEMPCKRWSDGLIETVLEIEHTRGLTVVLAHVERYDPKDVQILFENGIHGQMNVTTLTSFHIKKYFKKWIEAGFIVALGSDLHGTRKECMNFAKVQRRLKHHFYEIMKQTECLLIKQTEGDINYE